MKEINLTKGQVALVDDEDFEQLNQWKWHANWTGWGFYAYRVVQHKGKRQWIMMHRLLLNAPVGEQIDHIDANGLNNCRNNLRLCDNSQNQANSRKRSGTSSQYKGVCWDKSKERWAVDIRNKDTRVKCGCFTNEVDAAIAYNEMASKLYGEFARLNVVPS